MIRIKSYVPIVLFLFFIVLSFFIIKPILIAIFLGALLAFALNPLYKLFSKKLNKTVSALLICVIVLAVLLIPGVYMVKTLVNESYVLFISVKQKLAVGFFSQCENNFCTFVEDILGDPSFGIQLKESFRGITNWIIEKGSNFLISLPGMILNLFVIFFTMFYFLKDGKLLIRKLYEILGMHHQRFNYLMHRLKNILQGVVYGYLLVALIQGALGALGFLLFGISSPLFWGLVMAFFALIPFLGTGVIWLPASLYVILDGVFQNSTSLIVKGIGLLVYSAIFVGMSDNLLRPKLMGGKAKIHPVIILVGIIGGVIVFGVVGVLIGPLILSLTSVLIDSYLGEQEN